MCYEHICGDRVTRRQTVSRRDAVPELTWMYSRRVCWRVTQLLHVLKIGTAV